jgi:hypothetical protein
MLGHPVRIRNSKACPPNGGRIIHSLSLASFSSHEGSRHRPR